MRKLLLLIIFVLISQHSSAAVSVTKNGVAIGGYDPVAYFTLKEAIKGDPKIRHKNEEEIYWLFSSEENKQIFLANPDKYLPEYGGFCAFAMGYRVKAQADPRIFTIHDKKLYLNQSAAVRKKWLKKKDTLIKLADSYWPRFK